LWEIPLPVAGHNDCHELRYVLKRPPREEFEIEHAII
jgi:hypothetical protein